MLLDFRCLNIQYVKTFHPIVMKLTAYTKLDMRMLFINFLSDLKILTRCYNYRLYLYIGLPRLILVVLYYKALNIKSIGYIMHRNHISYL